MDTGKDRRGILDGKKKMRAEMRERLARATAAEKASWSSAIRESLAERFRDREVVAFMSLASEPEIGPVLRDRWNAGAPVILPRVEGGELVLHIVAAREQLVRGSFGVWEPSPELPVWQPGGPPVLCLVPGLAWDRRGHRLGRGRGYYDRLLALHGEKLETVGVFFDCQRVVAVPSEVHDQTLCGWVTESGFGCPGNP